MATVSTTPPRLTEREHRVISAYARGDDLAKIAQTTGLSVDQVHGIVMTRTVMNRQYARELLRQQPTQAPAPTAPPAAKAAAGTLEELLTVGEEHEQPRIRAVAGKARAQLGILADLIREHARVKEAEARVAALEAELAKARALLPVKTHRGKGPASDVKAIREWARTAGVDLPDRGKIPHRIRDAYTKAQKGTA